MLHLYKQDHIRVMLFAAHLAMSTVLIGCLFERRKIKWSYNELDNHI